MLTLDFHIKPGKDGVYDGVELAEQLLRDAVNAMLPYVGGCPECLEALFSVVSETVLDEFQEQKRYGKLPEGWMIATGDDLREKMERLDAHLIERRREVQGEVCAVLADAALSHRCRSGASS